MNLFNRRVTAIATIFWKRNASIHHDNIFSSYSGYLHVHNYTKIKGLDLGKITSLPNVFNLHVSLQSSPKINRMLITRLICIQWVSSRIFPQLPQSPLGTPGSMPPFSRRTDRKKKNGCIFRVSLCLSKQATNFTYIHDFAFSTHHSYAAGRRRFKCLKTNTGPKRTSHRRIPIEINPEKKITHSETCHMLRRSFSPI